MMNFLKQSISIISLIVYVVFSQFVITAWATTDDSLVSSGDVCVIKKLDALESKYGAWKLNNTLSFDVLIDVEDYFLANSNLEVETGSFIEYSNSIFDENYFDAHAPPDILEYATSFVHRYIGIVLLLH